MRKINKIPQESLKKKMFYLANLNKEKGDLESSGYEKEYNDMKKKDTMQNTEKFMSKSQ